MKFEYFGGIHPADPRTGRPALADLGSALSIGSSVVGGFLGDDAASSAADASAQNTRATLAAQQAQAAQNRADLSPYRLSGNAANSKLSYLLGLNNPDAYASAGIDRGKYQTGTSNQKVTLENFDPQAYLAANSDVARSSLYGSNPYQHFIDYGQYENRQEALPTYDDAAMNAALNNDPNYGSLLRNFSANDLANDPVYNSGLQFGLDQGVQGINRMAAAGGSLNSGSTLKALTKYANDYGSTKAQQAYNNFNTNKQNTYSMLSGTAQNGQNAAAQTASNGLNSNNAMTATMLNNSNNQANAAIANGTNWANSINSGVNNYLYNNRTSPANTSIFGSGTNTPGGGINLSNYTNQIPWYQS